MLLGETLSVHRPEDEKLLFKLLGHNYCNEDTPELLYRMHLCVILLVGALRYNRQLLAAPTKEFEIEKLAH